MKRLLGVLLGLALLGCTTPHTVLQTARVLPAGKSRYALGFGYFSPQVSSNGVAADLPGFWWLEPSGRWGLARHFDVGAKLAVSKTYAPETYPVSAAIYGPLSIDGKFQFLDRGNLAASVGLSASYTNVTYTGIVDITAVPAKRTFLYGEFSLPVLVSLDLSPYFSLYASETLSFNVNFSESSVDKIFATTLGVRVGKRVGAFVELSRLIPIGTASFQGTNILALSFYFTSSTDEPAAGVSSQYESGQSRIEGRGRAARTAKVLKVRAADRKALLSQPKDRPWAKGERVCLQKIQGRIACGTVTLSGATGALLDFEETPGPVSPGMEAIPETTLEDSL